MLEMHPPKLINIYISDATYSHLITHCMPIIHHKQLPQYLALSENENSLEVQFFNKNKTMH